MGQTYTNKSIDCLSEVKINWALCILYGNPNTHSIGWEIRHF